MVHSYKIMLMSIEEHTVAHLTVRKENEWMRLSEENKQTTNIKQDKIMTKLINVNTVFTFSVQISF